jgi:hypothetical protein
MRSACIVQNWYRKSQEATWHPQPISSPSPLLISFRPVSRDALDRTSSANARPRPNKNGVARCPSAVISSGGGGTRAPRPGQGVLPTTHTSW